MVGLVAPVNTRKKKGNNGSQSSIVVGDGGEQSFPTSIGNGRFSCT
jgi:hypothetical protein